MNKFELRLDFDEIRNRIELDMSKIKPGEWAKAIGISKSLISNVHGGSKRQNPPLPYIIAVARHTGKPVEWYLYGEMTTQFTGTISESQLSLIHISEPTRPY